MRQRLYKITRDVCVNISRLPGRIKCMGDSTGRTINASLRQVDAKGAGLPLTDFLAHIDSVNGKLLPLLMRNSMLTKEQAQLLLLKTSNLLVGKYGYRRRLRSLASRPFGLVVDPVNTCILHCPGCVHTNGPVRDQFIWPPGMLSERMLGSFLERFGPYATHAFFYNYGEPLLNKKTPDFIRMARRFGLSTSISSNLALPHLDFDDLVLSGLDFMVLSIDGASADTYARYRRGGDFGVVMENLRRLVAAKKRLQSYTPFIEWQFLVFTHNSHEIEAVKRLAADSGVNKLHITVPFDVSWDDPSIQVDRNARDEHIVFSYSREKQRESLSAAYDSLDEEAVNRAFEKGWTDAEADDAGGDGTSPLQHTCDYLYKVISMDATGRVMPCCRPPAKNVNLVFGQFGVTADPFNTEMSRLSRLFFDQPASYAEAITGLPPECIPFCPSCPAPPLRPLVDTGNVRDYLYSEKKFDLYSAETVNMLTAW